MPIKSPNKPKVKPARITRGEAQAPEVQDIETAAPNPAPTEVKVLGLPILNTDVVVRQSAIKSYEKCPRYGFYSSAMGLRPRRRSKGRDEGSYFHHCFRVLAETRGDLDAAKARLKELYDAVIAYTSQYRGDLTDREKAEMSQSASLGLAGAVRLWGQLNKAIKNKTLSIVGVEKVIKLPIGLAKRSPLSKDPDVGTAFRPDHQVQIDMILEDHRGRWWPWDHKYIGTKPSDYTQPAPYAIQAHIYTACLRRDFPDKEIPGFLYGLVQKPTCRRKGMTTPGKTQTIEDYYLEIDEWYEGKGRWKKAATDRKSSPPIVIHQQAIPYDLPEGIVRRILAYVESASRVSVFVEAVRAGAHVSGTGGHDVLSDLFPRHDGACQLGNIKCDMLPICAAHPKDRHSLVSKAYTQDPDPMDSDPNRFKPA